MSFYQFGISKIVSAGVMIPVIIGKADIGDFHADAASGNTIYPACIPDGDVRSAPFLNSFPIETVPDLRTPDAEAVLETMDR